MDQKKIGNYIMHLRKKHKISQEELASKVFVSRQAISKWETGKTKPDNNSLKLLSETFNVDVSELLLGKKLNVLEKMNFSLLLVNNYDKEHKKVIFFTAVIIILLMLFLAYYFFNTFNTIKVYKINFNDNDFKINDGIFVTTREKIYFNIGTIESEKEIISLELKYKDKLICKTDDTNIALYEYYGYNEYFSYKEIDDMINNLYLNITYEDDEQKNIKLNVVKDFANIKIFNKKSEDINDISKNKNKDINIDINLIKNKFIKQDNNYIFTKKDLEVTYLEDFGILNMNLKDDKMTREWNYELNNKIITYQEYDQNDILKELECNSSVCPQEFDFFFSKINEITN